MKDRIQHLLEVINQGIYEKDSELALALLAALAGESIILLGPPGTAKSMIARRLKHAFQKAHSFEYLMSRFSTPDEIFGPVSISMLKNSDRYERVTEGFLPDADVVFLDEIWKAGPAIQNTLLTVMNEKLFRNGNKEIRLPLKLLVAASNELPAKGEGLEALWDRFIIRVESHGVREESKFRQMLLDEGHEPTEEHLWQISSEEYAEWQDEINKIGVDDEVMDCIMLIRRALLSVAVNEEDERRSIYISDRRWKNIVRLLRTSAFMHDRLSATKADLLPVYHCLWQEPEERDAICSMIVRVLFASEEKKLVSLKAQLAEDIRVHRVNRSAERLDRISPRDRNKRVFDDFYYHVIDTNSSETYMVVADYQNLPVQGTKPEDGIRYQDKKNPGRYIIRSYRGGTVPVGCQLVSLSRDDHFLYVDDVRYDIETLGAAQQQDALFSNQSMVLLDYEAEMDVLASGIRALENQLRENMFASKEDLRELDLYLKELFQQLAFTRQEIGKLYV